MEKQINNFNIKVLDKADISKYIETVFSSDVYKSLVKGCDKSSEAIIFYRNIGKILMSYITSTGDISLSSANTIMRNYFNATRQQGKDFNISYFYVNSVLPLTMYNLGYKVKTVKDMTIEEILKLEEHIQTISFNNQFYSHSFSGALFSQISQNGLDISQEMFTKEMASLSKLAGNTPFKTGKLCYVELGEHSFQYATKAPERLSITLNLQYESPQKDGETLHDYYKRCLEERLNKSEFSESEKLEIRQDVGKMIDFYYGQDKSCIAVMSGTPKNTSMNFASNFLSARFTALKYSIKKELNESSELAQLYVQVEASLKNKSESSIYQLEQFRKIFQQTYPNNNQVEQLVQNLLVEGVTHHCLNNFSHTGYGDGFVVPSGKLSPETFSLATFDNIYDLYATQKIMRGKEEIESKRKSVIKEIQELLKIDLSSYVYEVDPNKYNGIPYMVAKDKFMLSEEEKSLCERLELLWMDGVIDLQKKSELRSVINSEFSRMKDLAPLPSKRTTQEEKPNQTLNNQSKSPEVVDSINAFDRLRLKYGYDEMSEEEKADFDEKIKKASEEVVLDDRRKRFKKILDGQGIDVEDELDFERMFERGTVESTIDNEEVERVGRRM